MNSELVTFIQVVKLRVAVSRFTSQIISYEFGQVYTLNLKLFIMPIYAVIVLSSR